MTLHLGDCLGPEGLATLADGGVGCVITDPPYSERVHRGAGAARNPNRPGENNGEVLTFSYLTATDRGLLAKHFVRLARRWIIVFSDEEGAYPWMISLRRAGAEWCVKGTWLKDGAMPRMDGTRPAYGTEAICIAHAPRLKGKTRWNGGGKVATYSAGIADPGRTHPTQKPLALMGALVRDFTDPGELVLDPFAGSGTTLVACKRLGRQFIGWERDPAFHAAAVRRLDATREQLVIPQGRAPKAKQGALL